MTTETANSKGGAGLKKKRSAFGWLKKAFSLDEEERAAFEQRRREQMGNDPYAGQAQNNPKFLDGRRIDRPANGYAPSQYSRQGY